MKEGHIGFENLRIDCIIGVYPEERIKEQVIYVDLKVRFDISKCVMSDSFSDTVDYIQLARLCRELAVAKNFQLLESYAHYVLKEIFAKFPVTSAWIKVRKPAALPESNGAIVELEEQQSCGH